MPPTHNPYMHLGILKFIGALIVKYTCTRIHSYTHILTWI